MRLIFFGFGLLFGSFLDVIATRYDGRGFVLSRKTLGGRSRCPSCGRVLTVGELIPLVSFALQRGRCASCRAHLSMQYPVSELLSAVVFAVVPFREFSQLPAFALLPWLLPALWTAVFLTLLLIALIDFRLTLIPDELTVFLVLLGVAAAVVSAQRFGYSAGSFLGPYALLFGLRGSPLANRLAALAVALGFFGLIVILTRGRGMGLGDLKLVGALAILYGWPDIIAVIVTAFVLGSLVGIGLVVQRLKGMRSRIPFGPFLAAASFIIFLWGESMVRWYFGLFSL